MKSEEAAAVQNTKPQKSLRIGKILQGLTAPLLAMVAAVLVGALFVLISGRSPIDAYASLLRGSFGSTTNLGRSLLNATPLVLTGLAVAFTFRAGLFNAGGEGQFFLGALTAAWLGITLPFEGVGAVVVILLAGAVAGGLWGAIPGFMKAKMGASEVVTTIMLNFVATYFNTFVVLKLLKSGTGFPGTPPIPVANRIARISMELFDRAHWGILIALAVAAIAYLILWRTSWGYELRVTGLSPSTAKYAGIPVARNTIVAMAIAGAFAGLGGAIEVLGVYGKMVVPFATNLGNTGIAVALMGRVHPIGVVFAAILLGGLSAGGQQMQFAVNVPLDLVVLLTGFVLLFITASRIPPVLKVYWAGLNLRVTRQHDRKAESSAHQS